MNDSIETIKITSLISIIFLAIALFMGSEYFQNTSDLYIFGLSWSTIQNIVLGIAGSAVLMVVSAGIFYFFEKNEYLDKAEQYLILVCSYSKSAFVHIQKISNILETGILSKDEKGTIVGAVTILSEIEKQQQLMQPISKRFLLKYSQLTSFHLLLCGCHEFVQKMILQGKELEIKYKQWELNDNLNIATKSLTGRESSLLISSRSCSEEALRLIVNQLSWHLNNVIQCSTLVISQLFFLRKKEDKLASIFKVMDEQAEYYQKSFEIKEPSVDKKVIAEHQIKIVQEVSKIESLLCDTNSPAITMMTTNPYSYVNALVSTLNSMRACSYEASVLYSSDRKLNFDINSIVNKLAILVEQGNQTISLAMSLQAELSDVLKRNGIDLASTYYLDPKLIKVTETFLKEKTPYGEMQILADDILKIIRSDDFKKRLCFGHFTVDSDPQ